MTLWDLGVDLVLEALVLHGLVLVGLRRKPLERVRRFLLLGGRFDLAFGSSPDLKLVHPLVFSRYAEIEL